MLKDVLVGSFSLTQGRFVAKEELGRPESVRWKRNTVDLPIPLRTRQQRLQKLVASDDPQIANQAALEIVRLGERKGLSVVNYGGKRHLDPRVTGSFSGVPIEIGPTKKIDANRHPGWEIAPLFLRNQTKVGEIISLTPGEVAPVEAVDKNATSGPRLHVIEFPIHGSVELIATTEADHVLATLLPEEDPSTIFYDTHTKIAHRAGANGYVAVRVIPGTNGRPDPEFTPVPYEDTRVPTKMWELYNRLAA